MNSYNNAILVEPGMKYFINNTLNQCKLFKDRYINFFYNISLLVIFVSLLSLFLYYRYSSKLTKEEEIKQNNEKQKYLMSKIKNFKMVNDNNNRSNLITNLPGFTYY